MSPSFTPTLFGNSGTRSRWYLASFLVTPGGSSSLARSPYSMAFACVASAFAERLVLIGHRACPGLISCWLARPAEVATARTASEHTSKRGFSFIAASPHVPRGNHLYSAPPKRPAEPLATVSAPRRFPSRSSGSAPCRLRRRLHANLGRRSG